MKQDKLRPHDAFMKSLLADVARARCFLSGMLPTYLVQQLHLQALQIEDRSFVRDDLREFFSDALFRVPLRETTDKEVIVSILLEHKSYRDERVALQMLTYLVEGYRMQAGMDPKFQKPLPEGDAATAGLSLYPIIPFLFYHGRETWEFLPFHQMFGTEYQALLHFVPTFETIYSNLRLLPENDIAALEEAWLRAALLTQKYSHDPSALIARFSAIFQPLSELEKGNFFRQIVLYYIRIVPLEREAFKQLWEQLPGTEKSTTMEWYDVIIEEGYEKGRLDGLAQGLEQGLEINKKEIIRKGIRNGVSIATLSMLTAYTEEEILRIISEDS